jgi:hypothetical protein
MADPVEREGLLSQEVVYDGEKYERDTLQKIVDRYQSKHEGDLKRLAELRKAHEEIAAEMTRDLAETKTAWDYLRGLLTEDFGDSIRGLLEKIPILNEFVADRPLSDLLREKIEIAERRTKEVARFLTNIERSIRELQEDIVRLNKKVVVAAHNEEKAAKRVLELKEAEESCRQELETIADTKSAAHREKDAEIQSIRQLIWETGSKLRLYSNAEDRIASIVSMNNNFLQILTNLHTNMQSLYDAGMEVLDELRGNLSGLSTAAEASEITLEMQEAMKSLQTSVNKVATLASNTSLYLTQNIDRLTSEMRIYDDATEALVKSNLDAEREIQEQRINETIALAEQEYGLMKDARDGGE